MIQTTGHFDCICENLLTTKVPLRAENSSTDPRYGYITLIVIATSYGGKFCIETNSLSAMSIDFLYRTLKVVMSPQEGCF